MRNTKQKEAILSFLREKRQHYSATEIYDGVRKTIPDISLGTVYRNLGIMVDNGEILSIETTDKSLVYDGFITPHDHFLCKECKKIFDFEKNESVSPDIKNSGFLIEETHTVYYGLCKKCLENKKENY